MYIAVEEYKIRFIDSINFVNDALATFPKTFGFSELKKGYFPHYFNTLENQQYIGPIRIGQACFHQASDKHRTSVFSVGQKIIRWRKNDVITS